MPSMRPQPSSPPAQGGSPRKTPAEPVAPPAPALTEEEERARAGGFHESSYELRTGLDMLETEWPDDTTIPGALGDS